MPGGVTKEAKSILSDLLPSASGVSDALENVVLPGTGIIVGYLAADFMGPEDAIAGFLLERLAAGDAGLTAEQRQQIVWATNGATIAVYSVILLVGLGFWSGGSKWLGPIVTGVGGGLILNKLVDTVMNTT